jgi:hypothetical protein
MNDLQKKVYLPLFTEHSWPDLPLPFPIFAASATASTQRSRVTIDFLDNSIVAHISIPLEAIECVPPEYTQFKVPTLVPTNQTNNNI